MKTCARFLGIAIGASVLFGSLLAADSVTAGKVKAVELEKREFIMTDSAGKDRTVKYDEDTVINRGGRDGQSELKVNDVICLYYETRGLLWRANFVLVQEGDTKNWSLGHGNVKSNDTEKKEISYTDDQGRTWTYSTVDVPVFINRMEAKVESIKVGERVMALLQKAGDRTILKRLYVTRK